MFRYQAQDLADDEGYANQKGKKDDAVYHHISHEGRLKWLKKPCADSNDCQQENDHADQITAWIRHGQNLR